MYAVSVQLILCSIEVELIEFPIVSSNMITIATTINSFQFVSAVCDQVDPVSAASHQVSFVFATFFYFVQSIFVTLLSFALHNFKQSNTPNSHEIIKERNKQENLEMVSESYCS